MLNIIIPATASTKYLRPLCESLLEYTDWPSGDGPIRIMIVSNTDDIGDSIAHERVFSELRLLGDYDDPLIVPEIVSIPRRVGYVRACNIGWQVLRPDVDDYICVLNDDLVFKGKWAGALRDAIDVRGALLVGPSIKAYNSEGCWAGSKEDEVGAFIEGWCWMAKAQTIYSAARMGPNPFPHLLYDPGFEPAMCEDIDLNIRVNMLRPGAEPPVLRHPHILCRHERTVTTKDRGKYWPASRRYLIQKWQMNCT